MTDDVKSVTITVAVTIRPHRSMSGLVVEQNELLQLASSCRDVMCSEMERNADEIADKVSDATGWCINGTVFDADDASAILSDSGIIVSFDTNFDVDFDTSEEVEYADDEKVIVSSEKTAEGVCNFLEEVFSFIETENNLNVQSAFFEELEACIEGCTGLNVDITTEFTAKTTPVPQP